MRSRLLIAAALSVVSAAPLWAAPGPTSSPGFINAPLVLEERPDALTWGGIRDRVRDRAPSRGVAQAEVAIAAAGLADAERYPNPELGVAFEEGGIHGPLYRPGVAKASLRQTIITGGKRARARDVATADIRTAEASRDAITVAAVADAARDYVRILELKYRALVAIRGLALAEWSRELTRGRIRGGDLGEGALHRVDAAVFLAVSAAARADGDLQEGLVALSLRWDGSAGEARDVAGVLPAPAAPPPIQELLARAPEAPAVSLMEHQVARAEAAGRRARVDWSPDISLEAGYVATDGLTEHGWLFGVAMPLPAFDRNQGARALAAAELRRARMSRGAQLAGVRSRLLRTHARLRSLHQEWSRLQEQILPAARLALKSVHEGFMAGDLTLLDVVAGSDTLLAVQGREIDLRVEHALARIDLAETLGEEPGLLATTEVPQ